MSQTTGKNSATEKVKSRLQNPRTVWGKMKQTEWVRRKNRVPKKFLSARKNSGGAGCPPTLSLTE